VIAAHHAGQGYPQHDLQPEKREAPHENASRQSSGSLAVAALVVPQPEQPLPKQAQQALAT
jgi:hypothetical protein